MPKTKVKMCQMYKIENKIRIKKNPGKSSTERRELRARKIYICFKINKIFR